MTLTIENLCPNYLTGAVSDIWGKKQTFEQGENVFVAAASGTGKTSLVQLLYGLRKDATGSVLWDHLNVFDASAEALSLLRKESVAIVFQDLRLFPDLTLWENLMIKKNLGTGASETEIEDWIMRLGLSHRKDSIAQKLSYGEQQRTAIVRALIAPFKWLLLDEPFSHLDTANASKALALITEVSAMRKAGILYAELDDNPAFMATQKLSL